MSLVQMVGFCWQLIFAVLRKKSCRDCCELENMYFCTYNYRMEIEFDPEKEAINPLNHEGVTFEEAKPVLLDPYALTREDKNSADEHRYITLGLGKKNRVLVVIWTLRDERIRLISAWKANKPQRKNYEQQY